MLCLVFTSSTAQAAFKGNSVPKQAPLLLFLEDSYVVTMCSGGSHQQVNDHATLNNYSQTADYSLWNEDNHANEQQWPSGSIDDANI